MADGVSIQSEAISRKSKYRARAATVLAGKHPEQTVSSATPKMPKLGDSSKPLNPITITEKIHQHLRPKNLFQGVYFPCMGFIVSGGVLSGTEIFPFSPKQEKLHFARSTTAPLDHLDGEPNDNYFDGILTHMSIKFDSWEVPDRTDFLDEGSLMFEQV